MFFGSGGMFLWFMLQLGKVVGVQDLKDNLDVFVLCFGMIKKNETESASDSTYNRGLMGDPRIQVMYRAQELLKPHSHNFDDKA